MKLQKRTDATTSERKRILSVTIKRIADESPDFSYLGEFSNSADTEFAIEHGQPRGYRWFNPGTVESFNPDADWLAKYPAKKRRDEWYKAMEQNAKQDYARVCGYNDGQWYYMGIRAEATIQLTGDLTHRVSSGGLWGIESDSDKSYFAEVEADELANLQTELHAMGFSKRAITAAFRDVQRSDD